MANGTAHDTMTGPSFYEPKGFMYSINAVTSPSLKIPSNAGITG